jgi:hypothetical protein
VKLTAPDLTEAGFIFAFVFKGLFKDSRLNSSSFQRWHPPCKGSCQAGGKTRRPKKTEQQI